MAPKCCSLTTSAERLGAVKSQATGNFILNAKSEDATPKTFIDTGLEWEYTIEDGKETLKSNGPLHESIIVLTLWRTAIHTNPSSCFFTSFTLNEQRKNYARNSLSSMTETSQYRVEHLTTFVMDRKEAMVTMEDGLRKLKLLDAKGKVWTQDMLLQVDDKAVSLIDVETTNELEHFPLSTIQHCQSVMNACSYDSILALVCKEPGQAKPDLHLFQCDEIKGKLQSHIEKPSAPDLIHFLFTPLNMVIQTTGGVELASSVLSPLLTRDSVDFLHSCLTPVERQLWVSLGDAWTKPRQPSVQDFPPADGYAFSNTVFKRGPPLDQESAVAAFKQAVSRHCYSHHCSCDECLKQYTEVKHGAVPLSPPAGRKSHMEEVQDELMHRLTIGRSGAPKKIQGPQRGSSAGGPGVDLSYSSPPEEVKAWLQAKGFSPVTITSLGVLTGAQLFSLNKDELRTVCPDDGGRVYSQVTVQKAALEGSSGSSELQEIMRRRQEKLISVACDSGVESFDEGSGH
ncbi:UNVERIFIED_CONTAM: hypothetical protein FKN15_033038 [Acipenser sinensis]